jgi:hypothetical protein
LNLVYRDALFPRHAYRRAWEALSARLEPGAACRTMVALLALAHDRACEAELAAVLETILGDGALPEPKELAARFAPRDTPLPAVLVELPTVAAYDTLLAGEEARP